MQSAETSEVKKCFVISPIGEEGSDVRRAADTVFCQLIKPATQKRGLEAIRADHIRSLGQITTQVLRHLRDAEIVVADLSGLNANVFYELAFRHTLGKPTIILSPKGQHIPFDLADSRVIIFDPLDWTSLEASREDLDHQLDSALSDSPELIRNPITEFFMIEKVATIENDPMAQMLVRVNSFLERLDLRLEGIEDIAGAEWPTNAEYIDGQDDAFEALTKATREAKFSVRSSRFFPASIMGRPDYLQAIEERVRGSENRPGVQEYRRIIALNNIEKKQDVIHHIATFAAKPFTLFLTAHQSTFELVIIDDTDVFIHFAKEELVIASTLHLRGRRIAERFTEVFDQLASREQLAVFDCKEVSVTSLFGVLTQVDTLFKKVFTTAIATAVGEASPSDEADEAL